VSLPPASLATTHASAIKIDRARTITFSAGLLFLVSALGCEQHQAKCDDAAKRLSRETLASARLATGGDDAKLRDLWNGVVRDAEQGQKQCLAASDNRSAMVLEKVQKDAAKELDDLAQLARDRAEEEATQPAFVAWKQKSCDERWTKLVPAVTWCCGSLTARSWKSSGCEGKERPLLALLDKAAGLCKTLSGEDCKEDAMAQVDGAVTFEGGDWSVYYCPEMTCGARVEKLQENNKQLGTAKAWERTGPSWSFVHIRKAPKLSSEQEALIKKFTDKVSKDAQAAIE
jgi:hypothetical protein